MSINKTKRKVKSIVEKEFTEYRIDNYLSDKFEYHSRNIWQNLIKNGIITVNHKICKPSKIIKYRDIVEFIVENFEEPECNLNYTVVYEDKNILAVNKPYNCIIHPVGPFFKNTLTYKLEEDLGYPVYSINRLDRETTGIVLLGKDAKTAKILSQYFIDKEIYKEYTVAVHGTFPCTLSSKGYLLRDDKSTVRKKRKFQYKYPENISEAEFETSETNFILIKTSKLKNDIIGLTNNLNCIKNNYPQHLGQIIPGSRLLPDSREENTSENIFQEVNYGSNISLIKVILKTGRQHQIRATLCSLGYPVLGDKLYGIDDTVYLRFIERKLDTLDRTKLLITHQALHAEKLIFKHPYTKCEILIKVSTPDEITKLFN